MYSIEQTTLICFPVCIYFKEQTKLTYILVCMYFKEPMKLTCILVCIKFKEQTRLTCIPKSDQKQRSVQCGFIGWKMAAFLSVLFSLSHSAQAVRSLISQWLVPWLLRDYRPPLIRNHTHVTFCFRKVFLTMSQALETHPVWRSVSAVIFFPCCQQNWQWLIELDKRQTSLLPVERRD